MCNKYFWGLFIWSFTFLSCSKSIDDAIVENPDNPYKFKQITFTLNIVNSSNEYVNLTQIDSVTLKVNGKPWGTFKSESVDTSYKTSRFLNDLMLSNYKISYLIIAPFQLKTDNLESAGDIVNYLQNRIVMTPGDYVCEVSEIKFQNVKKEWVILKPQVYKDFKVVENTTSSYAGDISISIK